MRTQPFLNPKKRPRADITPSRLTPRELLLSVTQVKTTFDTELVICILEPMFVEYTAERYRQLEDKVALISKVN
jgi:hypothetical protein